MLYNSSYIFISGSFLVNNNPTMEGEEMKDNELYSEGDFDNSSSTHRSWKLSDNPENAPPGSLSLHQFQDHFIPSFSTLLFAGSEETVKARPKASEIKTQLVGRINKSTN